MSYRTRTEGTTRLERDLKREVPLGRLGIGWHTGTISVSVTTTSCKLNVTDSFGDTADTLVFLRRFDSPNTINERMKALLSAVCTDSNELMTLADALLDGEFHVIGSLNGRPIRVNIDWNGTELDIVRFARPTTTRKKLSF